MWPVHGFIIRTGYQTDNVALWQFFQVATQGTAEKKSLGPIKHFHIDRNTKIT